MITACLWSSFRTKPDLDGKPLRKVITNLSLGLKAFERITKFSSLQPVSKRRSLTDGSIVMKFLAVLGSMPKLK